MQRVVWYTTLLGLVSIWYTLLHHYLLTQSQARLLSFFGEPCLNLVNVIHISYLCIHSADWRFLYFHGQRHARLDKGQSVYDKPKRERYLLITLLSPLLFLAPEEHLRKMELLGTDGVIVEMVWSSLMITLLAEWHDVVLWVRIQRCIVIGYFVSCDCYHQVDSDASGQRRLSCYPWGSHFKS